MEGSGTAPQPPGRVQIESASDDSGAFAQFANALRAFEGRVIGLVLSSFLFSGVGSIVGAQRFGADFVAFTTLVGGAAGAAGLLSEYVSGLRTAQQARAELLRFDASRTARPIAMWFLATVAFLPVFYLLAREANPASALMLAAASFAFFKAMTKSFLAIQASEGQFALWGAMSQQERVTWVESDLKVTLAEQEVRRINRENLERLRKMQAESDRHWSEFNRTLARQKKRQRGYEWKRRREAVVGRFLAITRPLRELVPGDRLITTGEKFFDLEVEKFMEKMNQESRTEDITNIRAGAVPTSVVETSGVSYYRVHARTYVDLDPPTKSEAERLLIGLQELLPKDSETHRHVIAVIKAEARLSHEAQNLLEEAGIEVFREDAVRPVN